MRTDQVKQHLRASTQVLHRANVAAQLWLESVPVQACALTKAELPYTSSAGPVYWHASAAVAPTALGGRYSTKNILGAASMHLGGQCAWCWAVHLCLCRPSLMTNWPGPQRSSVSSPACPSTGGGSLHTAAAQPTAAAAHSPEP
jgi:hypothetical protein